jgi:hypothetical protein
LRLDEVDRELIHQELVGAVATVVDDYLSGTIKPKAG